MATNALNAEARNFQVARQSPTLLGPQRHEDEVREWVDSIMAASESPDTYNWVDGPYEHRHNPSDWIVDNPDMVETFWNVALGSLLQVDCFRHRPALTEFLLKTPPEAFWAVFCSSWAWAWESQDWSSIWESALKHAAHLLNGFPVDGFPICIPSVSGPMGDFNISWNIPYRCYFNAGTGRVDCFNVILAKLRIWYFRPNRCLVSNSSWHGVTITNCAFVRCTFLDCTFANVHFLDCTFTDVDFSKTSFRNSLISNTTITSSSLKSSVFESASWSTNTLIRCQFNNVHSERSNWTYIYYHGVDLSDYSESERSEHWVRMNNSR